jgi:hypothetical protein
VHFIIVIISQNIPSHELFKLQTFFEIYLIREQVHTVTPYQDKSVILNAHKRFFKYMTTESSVLDKDAINLIFNNAPKEFRPLQRNLCKGSKKVKGLLMHGFI